MRHDIIDICGIPTAIPVAESYRDCATLIRSDYFRHSGKERSMLQIWLGGLTRISVGFSFWFRLAQYRRGWLSPLASLMVKRYKRRWGLFIPVKTRVGYGLYIQHCCSIVVNGNAIIGNNVNIGQMTTIGSNIPGVAAHIGDNVYLGPGINVVDDVQIGAGATVGAGSVVTRSVPPATTVAGVPARKISDKTHPGFIGHPYPLPPQRP